MEEVSHTRMLKHPATDTPLPLFFLVLVGSVFGYGLSCMLPHPINDEGFHGAQIWHYYSGGRSHYGNITMFSTYHYVIAFIVRQIGFYHDYLLRFLNLVIGLGLLPIVYRAVANYHPSLASVRTLQLFFAPLVFPYFFVIYTDIWALLFLALCFYFVVKKRYLLAGLAGLAAVGFRQDAVIWVGLVYMLICFDGITLARPLPIRQALQNAFVKGGGVLAVLLLFIAFVIYNGGVAVGDEEAHQIQNFNMTNLYVMLCCAWFLFLGTCIQQLPQIFTALRKFWVWPLIIGSFAYYMLTLSNPHPYNTIMFNYFLHNGFVNLMMESMLIRALMFIPMLWMALTLCVMKYPDRRCYWLLLLAPIAAISHPLVEPRYYFPAYVLIQMWRPAMSLAAEKATLLYYIPLAGLLVTGTAKGWFFL